jgi:hypothetical protein
LSPGLPSNQWQLEITRWFETSLVKLQSYVVDFASNTKTYGRVITPEQTEDNPPGLRAAYTSQCKNQLVQSSSQVQSFSVLGLAIVIVLTLLLITVALALEPCVSFARRNSPSARRTARQADDKLHLLRMALGDRKDCAGWKTGGLSIPVTNLVSDLERPLDFSSRGLSSYQDGDGSAEGNCQR